MIARILTTAVIAIAVGLGVGWVAFADQQPDCPTEDSCTIDYRDGEWHIEEDVP